MISGTGAPAPLAIASGRGDLVADFRWFGDGARAARDGASAVEVWLAIPDVGGDRDARVVGPWLSAPERERRDRIQHPRALAEFLCGRRLIRSLLGELVGVAPADLRLCESERGALTLDRHAHGATWHFNLSHTDGLIALAIARTPVGIDVELTTRPGRTVELADRYFAPSETATLRSLPVALQRERFFDLWTLKEAYIKARGLGLALPLDEFAYALCEDRIAITVAPSIADVPDTSWRFCLCQVGTAHRLAMALRVPR